MAHPALAEVAAAADGAVAYQPGGGADTLKTVAGVAYIGLVIVYFFRLFKKRADMATSKRLASTSSNVAGLEDNSDSDDEEAVMEQQEATPVACFIGAAQAGIICYLLFLLSSAVDAYFDAQELPTQYTARNIAVLIQTVVRGLSYLVTFIFGANTLGLAGLGMQLLLFGPESLKNNSAPKPQAELLPKVSVTDDIFELRRAFEEAERMGKKQADHEGSSMD